MTAKQTRIIIEGKTLNGERFRPSDWAERTCGCLSTLRNHKIKYSPLLRPIMKDGYNCVIIDIRMADIYPDVYKNIMNFATNNNLIVSNIYD